VLFCGSCGREGNEELMGRGSHGQSLDRKDALWHGEITTPLDDNVSSLPPRFQEAPRARPAEG
jgi:hypothetical protein